MKRNNLRKTFAILVLSLFALSLFTVCAFAEGETVAPIGGGAAVQPDPGAEKPSVLEGIFSGRNLALLGAALAVAFIRLSAVFNNSCRGKIAVKAAALQHLPLASPIYINGAPDYRFATFFVEFLVMLAAAFVLMRFYFARRSLPMRGGESSDGHTMRLFLLIFSAAELILDSTRYDSSFMHFNGFVSIVQMVAAITVLIILVHYSRVSIRVNGRGARHWALWIAFFLSLVCVGLSEYFVQRHGDWYGRCYFAMFIGVTVMAASVWR